LARTGFTIPRLELGLAHTILPTEH
jgi:hypothetical protein